jgi:hypothetical protein
MVGMLKKALAYIVGNWDGLIGVAAFLGVPADAWPRYARAAWSAANAMTWFQVLLLAIGIALTGRWSMRRIRQRQALKRILIDAAVSSSRLKGGTAGIQAHLREHLNYIREQTGISLTATVDSMGNQGALFRDGDASPQHPDETRTF